MKTMYKTFVSCSLAALIFASNVWAEEALSHLSVGTRAPTEEALQQIQKNKEQLFPEEEEITAGRNAFCGTSLDRFPSTYYPAYYHWLVAVSVDGSSVEFEDGSVWRTSSYDGRKALNWRVSDPIAITQNTSLFSSYTYRLINKNTNASISADLFLGPIQSGEYTRYVVALDAGRGEMMLTDNTRWEICPTDAAIFSNWAINDAIIIGFNSGWESRFEAILVNVTMNNFVRAKQF